MTTVEDLRAEIEAVDPDLRVEWSAGVCAIHAPKTLAPAVEVRALRLVEAYTPQFVFRPDAEVTR